jgi:hypothetical protein
MFGYMEATSQITMSICGSLWSESGKAHLHTAFSQVAVTDPNLQSRRMQVPDTVCGKSCGKPSKVLLVY